MSRGIVPLWRFDKSVLSVCFEVIYGRNRFSNDNSRLNQNLTKTNFPPINDQGCPKLNTLFKERLRLAHVNGRGKTRIDR